MIQQDYRKVLQTFSDLSSPPSRLVEGLEKTGIARARWVKAIFAEYFIDGVWRRRQNDERDEDARYWARRIQLREPEWNTRLAKIARDLK
jgi:hypothetical protein